MSMKITTVALVIAIFPAAMACNGGDDMTDAGVTESERGADTDATAISSLQCKADEKCCDRECLKVECRSVVNKCTCASTKLLDTWFDADTSVVSSCTPIDGGLCCSDSNGYCDCTSGRTACGYEGSPTTLCTASKVMFCGHNDGNACQ